MLSAGIKGVHHQAQLFFVAVIAAAAAVSIDAVAGAEYQPASSA